MRRCGGKANGVPGMGPGRVESQAAWPDGCGRIQVELRPWRGLRFEPAGIVKPETTGRYPMIALFEAYPRLAERLPYVALGSLPTPVQRLERLESAIRDRYGEVLGSGRIYAKRDDLSGHPYGGNKVRKLEFLLGRALRDRRKAVLTFGAAGSNHALATALYARQAGMQGISMLSPQPNSPSVRKNLLMSLCAGAELHYSLSYSASARDAVYQLFRHCWREGKIPYLIPPGGSSALGIAGFVNAVFELKQQIARGEIPVPSHIYAASGTMGTVVGLHLGAEAVGLDVQVEAVRVTAAAFTSLAKARRYFRASLGVLRKADPSFPRVVFNERRFVLRHDCYGNDYGVPTREALDAIRLVQETEGIHIEGTYTGKAFAALLSDAAAGRLRDKTALFWNTYNSCDFSADIAAVDYRGLPASFHRYFETPDEVPLA